MGKDKNDPASIYAGCRQNKIKKHAPQKIIGGI